MKPALLVCWILLTTPLFASEFQLEKQKLKFSFEYESFVDAFRNEIITPGLKMNYLLKAKGKLGERTVYQIDFTSGAKTNLQTSFDSGELADFLWSNRLNTSVTVPFGNCYAGTGFFVRHKFVSQSSNQFIDIFGGLGFLDTEATVYFGFFPHENWEVTVGANFDQVDFKQFVEPDSKSAGGGVRISRRFERVRMNADYRYKKIDYERPIFILTTPDPITVVDSFGHFIQQEDDFQEFGVSMEFLHPFYISTGYFYQTNDSNNPGFSYKNHRLNLVIGTDLGDSFHIQAYGTAQRQTFEQFSRLQAPLFLDDTDYDTMGVSLTHSWKRSTELEVGVQRLSHNSSFRELDASKFLVFAGLSYRF